MKTKKLRLLSVLLMLCMVFSLMPLTVFAAEEYMLWVNGERFSSSKLEIVCGDGIAIYDTTTKTLTLKDATITSGDHSSRGIDSQIEGLNIILQGENKVLTHEVFVFDDVVISGNGSLSVAASGNDAIYVNGTLTIDGVNLDLMSETSDNAALLGGGIAAENDIIVKNGAEVSAIGADYAIASYGNLTITNSSITAKATKNYCNAIYCEYDIDITKSTVKGESYYPALFGDNINICNGSTVNAISTADWGMWCNGGLNITGNCDVTAIGDLASMGAYYSGISVTADIIDTYYGEDAKNTEESSYTGTITFPDNELGDYAYARVKTHNHNFSEMWKSDSANHWIECACGTKADFAVHIPGTAATETDPQVCTVCQYVITPATGHIHVNHLTKVNGTFATCGAAGTKVYYSCSCGKNFEDATASVEITQNIDTWKVIPATGNHTHSYTGNGGGTHDDICSVCYTTLTDNEACSGGAATCKDKAVCAKCGESYGELAAHTPETDDHDCTTATKCSVCGAETTPAKDHTFLTAWESDASGHWHKCSVCGGSGDTREAHTPGAAATETIPQTCTKCDYVIAPALGHIHKNNLTPHAKVEAECTVDGSKAYYSCSCGKNFEDALANTEITQNIDEWKKITAPGHTPNADDGDCTTAITCSVCGDETTAAKASHTGGTATCEAKAVCDVCGKEYGELGAHDWSTDYVKENSDADKHYHVCSVCGDKDAGEAHTWNVETATEETDKHCTVCNYVAQAQLAHTHSGELHKGTAATCTADGEKDYYTCSCGKFFEDSTCTKEIENLNEWKVVKAAGHKDEDKDYKCDVCGEAVGTKPTDPEKPTDPDNPQTGDNSNMALWIALLFVSGAGVFGTTLYSKRKRERA